MKKGLEEEVVRHIFLDLATTLVGIAIGFSVIFATDLGLGGIFIFVYIAVVILLWWWNYLNHRLRYIRPVMPFPTIDAALLIAISLFPCTLYGMASLEWPSYTVFLVLGSLFAIWSAWWHHTLQKFLEDIREYNEERPFKFHRQLFLEMSIIYFAGAVVGAIYAQAALFGGMSAIDIGFIALAFVWMAIRHAMDQEK